jgi:hypothetical protein
VQRNLLSVGDRGEFDRVAIHFARHLHLLIEELRGFSRVGDLYTFWSLSLTNTALAPPLMHVDAHSRALFSLLAFEAPQELSLIQPVISPAERTEPSKIDARKAFFILSA